MASCFCTSTDNPGLLGQLMLATVATHAARNSLCTCGIDEFDSTVVVCFGPLQEAQINTLQIQKARKRCFAVF